MSTPFMGVPSSLWQGPIPKNQGTSTNVLANVNTGPTINYLNSLVAMHDAIATSGILASTNTAPGATAPQPTVEIRRPWIEPPEGFSPYDYQGGVLLPVLGVASTTNLTSATGAAAVNNANGGFTVDLGYDGVINSLSCNFTGAGFTDFSGDITWILFRNNAPIRNFNNIVAQKGTVQQPRAISPIRIYSGDIITWVVIHASNPSLNGQVVCTLTGYTYPNRG